MFLGYIMLHLLRIWFCATCNVISNLNMFCAFTLVLFRSMFAVPSRLLSVVPWLRVFPVSCSGTVWFRYGSPCRCYYWYHFCFYLTVLFIIIIIIIIIIIKPREVECRLGYNFTTKADFKRNARSLYSPAPRCYNIYKPVFGTKMPPADTDSLMVVCRTVWSKWRLCLCYIASSFPYTDTFPRVYWR
jgi:hypothetical protein